EQLAIAADLIIAGEKIDGLAILQNVAQEIGAHAAAGEDADRILVGRWIVACILQGLPGAFEKDAVLRIGELRLSRVHREEGRIKFPTPSSTERARTKFGSSRTLRSK